ncbi:hypothetical protein [Algicola sagamiensis]|uniref:hypothetical protein n=1 Tax=Algicola sagamiensis TaxID=163869 RepID=UPI00037FB3E8|nr:hypothetical protein [Algicola sagamiensis]
MIVKLTSGRAKGPCEKCGKDGVLECASCIEGYSWLCLDCYAVEHRAQPISEYYKRAKMELKSAYPEYHAVSALYISRLIYCLRAFEKGDDEEANRVMKLWGVEL